MDALLLVCKHLMLEEIVTLRKRVDELVAEKAAIVTHFNTFIHGDVIPVHPEYVSTVLTNETISGATCAVCNQSALALDVVHVCMCSGGPRAQYAVCERCLYWIVPGNVLVPPRGEPTVILEVVTIAPP
jgi:hypothetical protein